MSFHKDASLGDAHIMHNWEYADAAARLAASVFSTSDIGKVCRELDTGYFYVLQNNSPVAWGLLTTPPGVSLGDPGSVTVPTLYYMESGVTPTKLTEVFIKFAGGTSVSIGSEIT